MKTYQLATPVLALLALMLGFQNCSKNVAFDAAVSTPQSKDSPLSATLDEVNGRDLSCDEDKDCVALAAGSKPCGGPSRYVVASARNPELEQVQALALQLTQQEHESNQQNNAIGTCEYLMAPTPQCNAHKCQASPQDSSALPQ